MKTDKNRKEYCSVVLLSLVLIISLIPVFLMSKYDCASGDDYNYGATAHLAFIHTGSILDAIKGAISTTVNTYYSWQGTWFDCFVFCLHPEVVSDTAYVAVPYIFVFMQIICYLVFAHHFLKIRWHFNGLFWVEVALVFLLFSFQLVPSQKMAIFWWVGSVHYAMPMCLALMGIVAADNYLLTYKPRYLIGLIIVGTLIGGATYPAALLLPEVVFVLWLERAVIAKKKDKRDALLLIPLFLEMVGLIISMTAPGNAIRSASDISEGAKPAGGVVATIIASLAYSVREAAVYFIGEKIFILLAFVIIAMLSWRVLSEIKANESDKMKEVFSHPLLFVITTFLLNASMYAPRLYAGDSVSTGYFNFNFWVFFLGSIACIIYFEGWLIYQKSIVLRKGVCWALRIGTIVVLCIAFFLGRHGIKGYTDYMCMDYYLSGRADDYLVQMKLQRAIMAQEDVMDVVVPEVNYDQGPLMQMPIIDDPENINNSMAARFYGKNSCRAIPRDEWEELYGPVTDWIDH